MPRAIPVPLRRQVLLLSRRGLAVPLIAASLELSPRTVRHLLRLPEERLLAEPYHSLVGPRPAAASLRDLAIAWSGDPPRLGRGLHPRPPASAGGHAAALHPHHPALARRGGPG